jgi:exonuclease III
VGDLNTPISSIDKTFRQKINKDILELNNTFDKVDLDIYRVFHPMTADYTFFSAHAAFSKIDHILGHKDNLNKYKKIEIIHYILTDHHGIKLEINSKKKTFKLTETEQHTIEQAMSH